MSLAPWLFLLALAALALAAAWLPPRPRPEIKPVEPTAVDPYDGSCLYFSRAHLREYRERVESMR